MGGNKESEPKGPDLRVSGVRCQGVEKVSGVKVLRIQTAEPQHIEVKKIVSFLSKTSAVRHSLFDTRYSKYNIGTL
jgi:hypothetical protein